MSNREIKFRGKRIDSGEWVYGHYIIDANERHCIYTKLEVFNCIPETIGQFTGLKDKNWKDIFEGDIIQQGNNPECWFAPRAVEFINGSWAGKHNNSDTYIRIYVEQDQRYYQSMVSNHKWEIIGNVHGNAELLKFI